MLVQQFSCRPRPIKFLSWPKPCSRYRVRNRGLKRGVLDRLRRLPGELRRARGVAAARRARAATGELPRAQRATPKWGAGNDAPRHLRNLALRQARVWTPSDISAVDLSSESARPDRHALAADRALPLPGRSGARHDREVRLRAARRRSRKGEVRAVPARFMPRSPRAVCWPRWVSAPTGCTSCRACAATAASARRTTRRRSSTTSTRARRWFAVCPEDSYTDFEWVARRAAARRR